MGVSLVVGCWLLAETPRGLSCDWRCGWPVGFAGVRAWWGSSWLGWEPLGLFLGSTGGHYGLGTRAVKPRFARLDH